MSWIREATTRAPAPSASDKSRTNSSPPNRNGSSPTRTAKRSRFATSLRSSFPTPCPRRSLTALKPSTSIIITAIRRPPRRAGPGSGGGVSAGPGGGQQARQQNRPAHPDREMKGGQVQTPADPALEVGDRRHGREHHDEGEDPAHADPAAQQWLCEVHPATAAGITGSARR